MYRNIPDDIWIIIITESGNYTKKSRLVCTRWWHLGDNMLIIDDHIKPQDLPANLLRDNEFAVMNAFDWMMRFRLADWFIWDNVFALDYKLISIYQTLTIDFIDIHAERVNWMHISDCQTLSEDFIRKNYCRLDMYRIVGNQQLGEKLLEELSSTFDREKWVIISHHQVLSESFILKYEDKVNWHNISRNQMLSEPFIRLMHSKIHFKQLSQNTWIRFRSEFLREFAAKLDFIEIGRRQYVPPDLLRDCNLLYHPDYN